jgi:hypothetical protein
VAPGREVRDERCPAYGRDGRWSVNAVSAAQSQPSTFPFLVVPTHRRAYGYRFTEPHPRIHLQSLQI